MKRQIMMINDELIDSPELSWIIKQCAYWAYERGYDPEKPLKISFKTEIFPARKI